MEIKYTLVRYKTDFGNEIGIVITDVLIDCMGNLVIDYYDLQVLDYFVMGNSRTDIGIDTSFIICIAWQGYIGRNNIPNDSLL